MIITHQMPSIKIIKKQFDKRAYALPELQREFVWNAKKACELLNSIYLGLPIGSAMIWEADRRSFFNIKTDLDILPIFDDLNNQKMLCIVDGQQRLSVMYQVFKGATIHNFRGREIDFSRICFALTPSDDYELQFVYPKYPDPKEEIPVINILAPNWKQRVKFLPKYKLLKIQDCRNKILDYRFPMVFIQTTDIGAVRESFLRINSRGTPVSVEDQAFARAPSLRYFVQALLTGLANGFKSLSPKPILLALALVYNPDIKDVGAGAINKMAISLGKRIEEDETAKSEFDSIWRDLKSAITKTIDFLVAELGVVNYSFLPSQNIVPALALFFYHNNGKLPSPTQRREIMKWFWATAVCQRYTGTFRRHFLSDIAFFKSLAERGTGNFKLEETISKLDLLQTDYGKPSSRSNAFFIMLAHQHPRRVTVDAKFSLDKTSSLANRKDRHHIFPKALLQKHGFTKVQRNSICNICFLSAEENQSFGNKAPHIYLEKYQRRKFSATAMKSLLIPHKSTALWSKNIKRGYRAFLRERMELIVKALEELAGIKLFRVD